MNPNSPIAIVSRTMVSGATEFWTGERPHPWSQIPSRAEELEVGVAKSMAEFREDSEFPVKMVVYPPQKVKVRTEIDDSEATEATALIAFDCKQCGHTNVVEPFLLDNGLSVDDFPVVSDRIDCSECGHQNLVFEMIATPTIKGKARRMAVNAMIQPIKAREKTTDSRGVVYTRTFGQAFLDNLIRMNQ